jgi:L-amino acid N-acyltransferase YncA
MDQSLILDKMQAEDWGQVKTIYLEGISTDNATFQRTAPSWKEWDESHLSTCRIVVRSNGQAVGWAALSPVSSRCVYTGVAEVSIYVGQDQQGKGIGSSLLEHLIKLSENNGIWTLQAGIFPENESSIGLHKKWGFKEVGRRGKIGKMNGIWRDVLLLERRSDIVGLD